MLKSTVLAARHSSRQRPAAPASGAQAQEPRVMTAKANYGVCTPGAQQHCRSRGHISPNTHRIAAFGVDPRAEHGAAQVPSLEQSRR